jgi:flavorubredoxin
MFGNTATVATAVADGLRLEGFEVVVVGVRDAAPGHDHDVLVVGAPPRTRSP